MGVALIAGAGPGIGSAVAKKFAAEGFQVIAARRNREKLVGLAEEIKNQGGRCEAVGCDLRKEGAVKDFVLEVENKFGPITVAVHNIGANIGHVPIAETTSRVFTKIWEMATLSAFLFGKEIAVRMVPRGEGTIIFTGATASLRGSAGFAAFSSAKFGKRALAQAMARELGPKGVHVAHVIIDGVVDTPPTREFFAARTGGAFEKLAAVEGLLRPDHVAEAYWNIHNQPKTAWTHELDLRPYIEKW